MFQVGDTAYVQRLSSTDNDDGFLDQEEAQGCGHSRVILSPGDEPHLHPPALPSRRAPGLSLWDARGGRGSTHEGHQNLRLFSKRSRAPWPPTPPPADSEFCWSRRSARFTPQGTAGDPGKNDSVWRAVRHFSLWGQLRRGRAGPLFCSLRAPGTRRLGNGTLPFCLRQLKLSKNVG